MSRPARWPGFANLADTSEAHEPLAVDPGKLRQVKVSEYLLRFVFGGAIALAAGVVSLRFGPRAGGLLLAFPAILPAGLTLIERRDGNPEARADVVGAILGACGLLAFAAVAFLLLSRTQPVVAIAAALVAWALTASGLFFLTRNYPK